MTKRFLYLIVGLLLTGGCKTTGPDNASKPTMWLTTTNQEALLQKLDDRVKLGENPEKDVTIVIDSSEEYQEMEGFGFSLTGGSAIVIDGMSDDARAELLQELFGDGEDDIRINYLRVSIGASDLDPAPFSYNDLPAGQTDTDLSEFSLDPDREYLIPVLKEILAINPDIKILGSPWSAPVWMKEGADPIMPTRGGSLQRKYHSVYADYFVKYVQAMAQEGITIDAITIQNEPHHPGNNPSMYMGADQQRDFIKDALGPAFQEAGISTKIILWDHNCDEPEYPISILDDAEARQYVTGSAFHLYAGSISALSTVKQAHPDKKLYFTEQWIGAPGNFAGDIQWHLRNLIIGAPRNWSSNVLQWNLAADPNQDPHTDGGCTQCLGGITVQGNSVTRNPAYYIVAHASKFVDQGAVRIESTELSELPNVAFRNPDGEIVLIMLNDNDRARTIEVRVGDQVYSWSMIGGSVATVTF